MGNNRKLVITGVSQITIHKKWVVIVVSTVVVFTLSVGWMFQVIATSRPVSAEYAKQHPLK